MSKEIKCPYCNKDLRGKDTMVRDIILKDNDWLGIENEQLINCNLTLLQPDYGPIICVNCKKDIDEYINNLLEDEILKEGF